jgi:DNA-nicking Smr family endonuclease
MKPSNSSSGVFKPFRNLKSLLESESVELQPAPSAIPLDSKASSKNKIARRPDHHLFNAAMADVKKISRTQCVTSSPRPPVTPNPATNPDMESVLRLKNLVNYGTGFVVSLTPEYIEGTAHAVNPAIARRLHRGDFSIQDHIDLHGMRVREAHEAFNAFLKKSILSGKRAVLVIHGRGLSSPAKPVLKSKVYRWLTTSPWHKWVIAFTSARLCDGGTGASYILLRRKPLAKRFRKKFC